MLNPNPEFLLKDCKLFLITYLRVANIIFEVSLENIKKPQVGLSILEYVHYVHMCK